MSDGGQDAAFYQTGTVHPGIVGGAAVAAGHVEQAGPGPGPGLASIVSDGAQDTEFYQAGTVDLGIVEAAAAAAGHRIVPERLACHWLGCSGFVETFFTNQWAIYFKISLACEGLIYWTARGCRSILALV